MLEGPIRTWRVACLAEFTRWASQQSAIEAVALAGLHARNTSTETSDSKLGVLVGEISRC